MKNVSYVWFFLINVGLPAVTATSLQGLSTSRDCVLSCSYKRLDLHLKPYCSFSPQDFSDELHHMS